MKIMKKSEVKSRIISMSIILLVIIIFLIPFNKPSKQVYIIGDSISKGERLNNYPYFLDRLYKIKNHNIAVNGLTCDEVFDLYNRTIPIGSIVILNCGINDILQNKSTGEIENSILNLISLATLKKSEIYVLEILPFEKECDKIQEINNWLDLIHNSSITSIKNGNCWKVTYNFKVIKVYSSFSVNNSCIQNEFIDNIPNTMGNKILASIISKELE